MRVIAVKNKEKMSQKAAAMIIERVTQYPSLTLGLATGSSPKGTYHYLIKDHKENGTSYKKVTSINLDEYIGLPAAHPNSFHYFMNEQLFQSIDIPEDHIYVPNGTADNLEEECRRYESIIGKMGGIDLQLLGIGENGHIGFNEPGTSFASRTHIVNLTESTRHVNARFFQSYDDVPRKAITMGVQSILQSKEILLLATGGNKSHAISRLLHGEIDEQFPASALKKHENVMMIADEQVLSYVG